MEKLISHLFKPNKAYPHEKARQTKTKLILKLF